MKFKGGKVETGNNHLTFLVEKAGLIAALKTYELSVKYESPGLLEDARRIVKAIKTGNTKQIMDSILEVGK